LALAALRRSTAYGGLAPLARLDEPGTAQKLDRLARGRDAVRA
jgi:hypothetical protein